jgi:hypothetical protein
LAPLVDSVNLYYVQKGNINLLPTDRKEISLNWQHTSFRTKNNFYYSFDLKLGHINNAFADSSITDSLGRTSTYFVNADKRQYLYLSGNLNKAIKFNKNSQLQLVVSPSLEFEKLPNSVNSVKNISNSVRIRNVLEVLFTYKDWFAANFKQIFYYYGSRQQINQNSSFHNILQESIFSVSSHLTRKLNLASNISFNSNSSTRQKINNFTIWNFHAGHHFFTNNSLELKFSVMDLLHQNTGVFNEGSGNKITNGTTNVLQQYYMVTLSYFPRKFGKGERK